MERTVFNAAQLEILDLMSYVDSNETLDEIKDLLSRYFAQKAELGNKRDMCVSGSITENAGNTDGAE